MDDRRNRKTTTLIQTIFLELLNTKPINTITITEICNRADINRGTFYLHYTDINDLSDNIENGVLDDLEKLLNSKEYSITRNTTSDFLIPILENIKSKKSFFISLNKTGNIDSFTKKLSSLINKIIFQAYSNMLKIANPNLLDYYSSYCIGATYGIILNWLNNECKESSKQISELVFSLVIHGMASLQK